RSQEVVFIVRARQNPESLMEPAALDRSLPCGYLPGARFRSAISLGGTMGRIFGFLSLVLGLGVGMYLYSRQVQSSSAATGAATPQATISITGVKTDLTTI